MDKFINVFFIIFPIVFLLEGLFGCIMALILISAPLCIVFLVLAIVNMMNVSLKKDENKNKKIDTGFKCILLFIELLVYSILHILVCSCGDFMVNVIPLAILYNIYTLFYFKAFRLRIEADEIDKSSIVLWVIIFIVLIIGASFIGVTTYSHDVIDFVEPEFQDF